MFDIFYFRPDGLGEEEATPTELFLDQLMKDNIKLYEKTLRSMELLMIHGNRLRMPYSESLRDGIFELRTIFGNNITRLFYFFDEGKIVIITHGIIKKTEKTPPDEIEYALEAKRTYFKRKEDADNEK